MVSRFCRCRTREPVVLGVPRVECDNKLGAKRVPWLPVRCGSEVGRGRGLRERLVPCGSHLDTARRSRDGAGPSPRNPGARLTTRQPPPVLSCRPCASPDPRAGGLSISSRWVWRRHGAASPVPGRDAETEDAPGTRGGALDPPGQESGILAHASPEACEHALPTI